MVVACVTARSLEAVETVEWKVCVINLVEVLRSILFASPATDTISASTNVLPIEVRMLSANVWSCGGDC